MSSSTLLKVVFSVNSGLLVSPCEVMSRNIKNVDWPYLTVELHNQVRKPHCIQGFVCTEPVLLCCRPCFGTHSASKDVGLGMLWRFLSVVIFHRYNTNCMCIHSDWKLLVKIQPKGAVS